jgi:hypothetical protein
MVAATAWAAYEPATTQSSEGTPTPKMQGSDNGAPSDSASPTTGNSGASPSPRDIGPRGVSPDALRHKWPNRGGTQPPDSSSGAASPDSSATPGANAEDQGTTDSQQAQPDNPASPFSPVNPAAPALQDPQGGDPTNPVTPASMRYMILA